MTIIKPGARSTVQDLGRAGMRSSGISQGGAVDANAMRIANLLVGNDEGDAGLECALVGPVVRFSEDAMIAICGDGVSPWRATRLQRDTDFSLERIVNGSYAYLAIAGGIDVPPVLGSRATELRASFGGFGGRALRAGDVLPIGTSNQRSAIGRWSVDHASLYQSASRLRIVRGSECDEFEAGLLDSEFTVTSQSDRMGMRLNGAALKRKTTRELKSSAVAPGTIQVPPDGQPIVLLADAQTLGGYPKIAHIISADLPSLAQVRPGGAMRFVEVSLEEAHDALRERERNIAMIRHAIRERAR